MTVGLRFYCFFHFQGPAAFERPSTTLRRCSFDCVPQKPGDSAQDVVEMIDQGNTFVTNTASTWIIS